MSGAVLSIQDRTLVDDESQEAVVRRSFNQFDEEGLPFNFIYKLEITSLDRGRTNHISLTHDLDLVLQSYVIYGHDPPHAKVQGQQLVGFKDRMETDGWRRLRYLPR